MLGPVTAKPRDWPSKRLVCPPVRDPIYRMGRIVRSAQDAYDDRTRWMACTRTKSNGSAVALQ